MSILQTGLVPSTGGYQIERSLRFNSADTPYLNRTPASASNRKTWTWSGWVKRSKLGTNNMLFMGRSNGTNYDQIRWNSDDTIYFFGQNAGADSYRRNTTPVYRDVSSWYHIVGVLDTTQATAANRVKLYINGVQVTAFSSSSDPTLNFDSYVNTTSVHLVGGNNLDGMYSDQYMTEINFIDGQALTPSSFGETDSATGVWKPKKYAGTYGTNGFYLNFSDNSGTTATTLGKDSSGNGNNWTPNNFSVGLVSSKVLAITQATFAGSTTLSTTIIGSGTVNLTGFGGCGNISGSTFTGLSSITGLLNNWQTHTVYKNGVSLFTITGGSVYNDGGSQTATQSRAAQTVTQNNVSVVNGDVISITFGANTATPSGGAYYGYPVGPPSLTITANTGVSISDYSNTDSFVDSPTAYGTDTGVGGEVRGNYCTLNPLNKSSNITLANGNLQWNGGGNSQSSSYSTMAIPSTGKWYFEQTITNTSGGNWQSGVTSNLTRSASGSPADDSNGWGIITGSAGGAVYKENNNSLTLLYNSASSIGAVIGFAVDTTNGKIWFSRNGTWLEGDPAAGTSASYTSSSMQAELMLYVCGYDSNDQGNLNTGQRPFAYTAPSGFKALCTQNLSTPTIGATATTQANKYFDVQTYTGNGTNARVITTNLNEVGLAWVKIRSGVDDHRLANVLTGGNKHLKSNNTDPESTATTVIQAFSSNTFTIGTDNSVNVNGSTYVAWAWDAGSSTVTNTTGTISAQVRANTTAGFSIVTYTGNGSTSSTQTIGHGLGVKPAFIITKKRSSGTTDFNWSSWHKDLGGTNAGIWLNLTNGRNNSMWTGQANISSTVFVPADLNYNNVNGETYVNYVFAPVAGFSAFGSYTGNGSADGPFIYTGFRPRWVLVKASSTTSQWPIWDAARNPYNVAGDLLYPNLSNAELVSGFDIDMVSNGFKFREAGGAGNDSAVTYIYAAFAESPFKYSLAR